MTKTSTSFNRGDGYRSIGDYAIIGDGRSAALVSTEGSIDWLCWPCFDAPSIFASLLGLETGGSWQISPIGDFKSSRKYIDGTNILQTTFETETGIVRLTDFMPVATEKFQQEHLLPERELMRIIEGLDGEVELSIRFNPRPQYATVIPEIVNRGHLGLRLNAGKGVIVLHGRAEFQISENGADADVKICAGEISAFSLTYATESPSVIPNLYQSHDSLERSTAWWREWSAQCSYTGPYRDEVLRSALTLKLLQFSPSGAFVAAVTSSLPEKVGKDRNYDYRYCWLRDASLTIHAMCGTGFRIEAEAFGEWTLHATRLTQPKLMVMYDVYGNVVRKEQELWHLSGYRNSKPVRVGNMARDQKQMDIYGEVVCGSAKLQQGKGKQPLDYESARVLVGFGKYVCDHWQEPDAGIWEGRDEPKLHTHSLLLCWVTLHELIGLVEMGALKKAPTQRFKVVRDEIRGFIESNAWDEPHQSYTSEPGTNKVDATLLLMAYHKFHEATSPRLRGTYERVLSQLGAGGPLLYRSLGDGISPESVEGAFGICGFWAVEYLAMGGGNLEDAEKAFESLLLYANDVGLYAEEIDPSTGAALGNFPQAFTHVGLISAALAIERRREQEYGTASAKTRRSERDFL